VEAAAILGRVK